MKELKNEMKTNRISRRKFLIKLREVVGETTEGLTTSEKIINAAMDYVRKNMSKGELGGLCMNELKPKELVAQEDGLTYLRGEDAIKQDFYLFFDDTDSLVGVMNSPENFEIVGGPEEKKGTSEKKLDPITDAKKQPIESLIKHIAKNLKILPKNYTEVIKKFISHRVEGKFDYRIIGLKTCCDVSYIVYAFRPTESSVESVEIIYENTEGGISLKYCEESTPDSYEAGEDEVESVTGFEEAFREAIGEKKEERKEGPVYASNSIKNADLRKLLEFRDKLHFYDVAEASSLLKVVEEEINVRKERMAKVDLEQFKDTYWKMNDYYIKILKFTDPILPAKCEVMLVEEDTIRKPKVQVIGIEVTEAGELIDLERITKEEYEKFSKLFE